MLRCHVSFSRADVLNLTHYKFKVNYRRKPEIKIHIKLPSLSLFRLSYDLDTIA
jgi:hypothetical protein